MNIQIPVKVINIRYSLENQPGFQKRFQVFKILTYRCDFKTLQPTSEQAEALNTLTGIHHHVCYCRTTAN